MTIDDITVTVKCTINTVEVLSQVQNTMHIQSTATFRLKQLGRHNAYHRFERRVNLIHMLVTVEAKKYNLHYAGKMFGYRKKTRTLFYTKHRHYVTRTKSYTTNVTSK